MQLRKAEEFAPAKLKRRFDVDFGGGGEGSQGMGEAYKGYKLESEELQSEEDEREEDEGEELESGACEVYHMRGT